MHQGRWIDWNCDRCPATTAAVRQIPGLMMAGFSVLEPGTHITEHRGPNKGALRYQLGVIVPGAEGDCRIRVGDEMLFWRNGEAVAFDFTVPHEAWNDSDSTRVLLMLEVLLPGLPRYLEVPNRLAQRAMGWFPTHQEHEASPRSARTVVGQTSGVMSTPDARPAVPACRAPWVAMDFDAFGNVQACCANALYPLGNVVESSLREIWDGPRAQRLRRMVAATGFGDGCSVCRHRVEVSGGDVPLDYYDQFDVIDEASWPSLLSFSLHNACNLQCIMCGADSSSSIRTRREGLAPLDHVYGESFFAELEPFLRRCVAVDFIGGEPFLVREHDRVWALLAEVNPGAKVSVTTNGTVCNDRVERLLELADTDVVVSVDGVTKETFERIRVGSDFESVVANLERFHRYCTRRGTGLYLSFSLVRQNWFEMGGVMLWAESLGAHVTVQTVIEREFGVQRLDTRALRAVVEALEAESGDVAPRLNLNRDIWLREVGRLRRELDARTSEGSNDLAQTLVMEPPDGGNRRRVTERIVAAPTHPARRGAGSRVDLVVAARQELLDWCPRHVPPGDLDRNGRADRVDGGILGAVRIRDGRPVEVLDDCRPARTHRARGGCRDVDRRGTYRRRPGAAHAVVRSPHA